MISKIGISTGVFYKHFKEVDLNEMIDYLRNLNVEVIEILFARPFMLDLKISDENITYLKNKELIIHSPFFSNIGYEDIIYDEKLIKKTLKKFNDLNAKHIVIHPDLISNFDIIKKYSDIFVFENLKEKRKYTFEKLLELNDSELDFKISLDIGHLRDKNYDRLDNLIKKYKNNIVEIQLSIKENYEDFLNGNINQKYSFLKKLEIPMVLETRPEELSHLNKILKNLRAWVEND